MATKNQIISADKNIKICVLFECRIVFYVFYVQFQTAFKSFYFLYNVYTTFNLAVSHSNSLLDRFECFFFSFVFHDLQRKHPKYLVPIFTIIYIMNIYI